MGCCLTRDDFEKQITYYKEIEEDLDKAIVCFNENEISYEDKKWHFNKIRKCNEDMELNIKKLKEIFERDEESFNKSGKKELKKMRLDQCVESSKIKILKVSKILLNYYVNFSQPQNMMEIGEKKIKLKKKKSRKG